MAEAVPNSDDQSLQNFISNSPWDDRALMHRIAKDADSCIGNDPDTCFLIDESSFKKSGVKSVGVARQWLGRYGKVDNGQVAVFGALNCREKVTLTDTRLFLPKSWTKSKQRMKRAGVPPSRYKHRKKAELAIEIIKDAQQRQSSHYWIGADALYGNDPWFVRKLDQLNEVFMVDIHENQHIYLSNPEPYIPERRSKKGPDPSRLKTDIKSEKVSAWAKRQAAAKWTTVTVRDSTTGMLSVDVLHARVWLWDGKEKQANLWHLIVRREGDSKNTYKYSMSNAPENTSLERLAFMQGQRYFIEHTFENAKSACGMAEYQLRGWTAWHHHMAMVMLVMLFMLKVQKEYKDTCCDIISCKDIRELLYHFLPRRAITKAEVLRQMQVRHRKRRSAMLSKQKHKLKKLTK